MFEPSQYELIDFGGGRKLERFGEVLLDRPAPAAVGTSPATQNRWATADVRFESASKPESGKRGQWILNREVPEHWIVGHDRLRFELKRTDFGHVGLFPEQAQNWEWIQSLIANGLRRQSSELRPLRLLNLFAYTGGSTLAAAFAGAEVTHVDAVQNTIVWARRNAKLSGLAAAPIRWIAEDAMRFVRRELKRGKRYDGVILDPPAYGHGPRGESWLLHKDLPELLSICRELLSPQLQLVLLTCHDPDFDAQRLAETLVAAKIISPSDRVQCGDLWLTASDNRRLHSGVFARYSARQ